MRTRIGNAGPCTVPDEQLNKTCVQSRVYEWNRRRLLRLLIGRSPHSHASFFRQRRHRSVTSRHSRSHLRLRTRFTSPFIDISFFLDLLPSFFLLHPGLYSLFFLSISLFFYYGWSNWIKLIKLQSSLSLTITINNNSKYQRFLSRNDNTIVTWPTLLEAN